MTGFSSENGKHRPLARGDACRQCKCRKVRCSGERPKCKHCQRRRSDCEYAEGDPSSALPHAGNTNGLSHETSDGSRSGSGLGSSVTGQSYTYTPPIPSETEAALFDSLGLGSIFPTATSDHWEEYPSPYVLHSYTTLNGAKDAESIKRDYLLRLYFSRHERAILQVHLPAFLESIHSFDPKQRPHQCLISGMMLNVFKHSHYADAEEEEVLCEQTKLEIDRALEKDGRFFDAVRAATLVAVWQLSKGRYLAAWSMIGKAVKLAQACGLHRLDPDRPLTNFVKPTPGLNAEMELAITDVDPPTSRIEVGERIYAFWALFFLDRCAAVVQGWPAGFSIEQISTPLPRALADYDTDSPTSVYYTSLHDILWGHQGISSLQGGDAAESSKSFNLKDPPFSRPAVIRSIILMHEASLLHSGRMDLCQVLKTKDKINRALLDLVESLPPELQAFDISQKSPSQLTFAGKVILPENGLNLTFVNGATRIFLDLAGQGECHCDEPEKDLPGKMVGGFDAESCRNAMVYTKRMVDIMREMKEKDTSKMTFYVIMIWSRMAQKIISTVGTGVYTEAQTVLDDTDVIIRCLRATGRGLAMANLQADKVEALKRTMMSTTAGR